MSRTKAILVAGGVTATVLFTLLVLTAINLVSKGVISINLHPAASTDPAASQLQNRQAALDQAASAMKQRQQGFEQQSNTAQMNIAQLKQAVADQKAKNEADQKTLAQLQGQANTENAVVAQLSAEAAQLKQKEDAYAAQINDANQQILALKQQIAQLTGTQP